MYFSDRVDAGRRLARRLMRLRGEDVVVIGLPRGGVPVALQIAEALDAPLDVIVVRKLGAPFQPELAIGAIGEGGVRLLNRDVARAVGVSPRQFAQIEERERAELDRRVLRFRGARPRVSLQGRTVVLVDDGVATGSAMRVACQVLRASGAGQVVVAVPVAPPRWTAQLRDVADELIALATPAPFYAIAKWYARFEQTTDSEVVACLERRAAATPGGAPAALSGS